MQKNERMNELKIGIVHTSVTDEEEREIEEAIQSQFHRKIEFFVQSKPDILDSIDATEKIPSGVVIDIAEMYINAVREECDLIFSACVAISTVCDHMQDFSDLIGIPIISIESGQCNEAIRIGRNIGVLGTISTSMEVVKRKIERLHSEQKIKGRIISYLIEPVSIVDKENMDRRIIDATVQIANQVDVIVLAQGSMAHLSNDIAETVKKPVLDNVSYAAKNIRDLIHMYQK